MRQKSTASVIIDGQAGSCGKGKLAAYLALRYEPTLVSATFGPNAGHTVLLEPPSPDAPPARLVFQHLPAASVFAGAEIFLSAGSIIEPELLEEEIRRVEAAGIPIRDRLLIHPRAAIIEPEDRQTEATGLVHIASTGKGVGAAISRKVMRQPDTRLAGAHPTTRPFTLGVTSEYPIRHLKGGGRILIETSQGYDLDINHGVAYPYCTSRQISAAQALADMALPPNTLAETYGVIRPYPIRVGNVRQDGRTLGVSGPYANDSEELTWTDVAQRAGMDDAQLEELLQQELTTVTKRLRRVFSFSQSRFAAFCNTVGPTVLALTFADQLNVKNRGVRDAAGLTDEVLDFVRWLEEISDIPVCFVGTGPATDDMAALSSGPWG